MRRAPLVRVVTLVLCLFLVTSCGSAADLAVGGSRSGAATEVPGLTVDGGVVVSSDDLDTEAAEASDPIPVVVYVEPLCPHCKAFDAEHGSMLQERLEGGQITLEYRLVSFLDNGTTERSSARAVNAALCAATDAGPAAYATYVHELLENQPVGGVLTDAALVALGDDAGASIESCVTGESHADLVASLSKNALGKISATPTVIVGGREFEGVPTAEDLVAALGSGSAVV
ncbi:MULTISPECIES: DsbA family protein [Mumia]|uniref:DsbA family protein n=1 Tax=Mumia TaxID=1546255 RepID=UPI001422CBC8|nr:thioredoxin domain-containing protein [Mumia sp. ZJ1417]QMW68017.1 thioredoxin domain-containing protein [Mumia sp. ZJ1417]